MSTEQMRQEFETAYLLVVNEGEEIAITEEDMRNSRRGDEYTGSIASGAWWAWQASRADVAVELPLIHRDNYANAYGYNCALEAVSMTAKRIEAAGLKVKP